MESLKIDWNSHDGIREVCRIVRHAHLAELMGVHRSVVANAANASIVNGKPYYFTQEKIDRANRAIQQAAKEMAKVRFSVGPLTEEEAPYSFGETPADQMRTFRKRFCAPYLLETSMGWTRTKAAMYFNSTTHYYYNKVSQIDLDMITRMAELAARDLERIRLVKDES